MKEPLKGLFVYDTLVHAVSGAAGSVTAMALCFPLDTVRTRLQLEENREAKNTATVMLELCREEGLTTLYRGMMPVLQSLCASNFIYFYTFHGLKSFRGESQQSAKMDLLLAAIAGAVNVLVTTPLWVVNTRLKMKGVHTKTAPAGDGRRSTEYNYSGLIDGLIQISQKEGVRGLWSGTIPSLILVSNPAIQFMAYETIKRHLQRVYKTKQLSGLVYFFVGAAAKALSTVITYPIQTVQAKLRHGHKFQDLSKKAGIIDIALYILRTQGVEGLYKGLEAKVLQTVLTAALMFLCYEKIAAFVFSVMLSQKNSPLKTH